MIPRIVIAGRPNTGKSTLFNRLTGTRRSITDPTAGVTRDLICEECFFAEHKVLLYDSGGIRRDGDEMDRIVAQKSLSVLDDADLILLMLDVRDFNAEDKSLVDSFRKWTDKTILVVNKIDDAVHDDLLWNFYSFGYPRVVGISAAHGRGVGELEDFVSSFLAQRLDETYMDAGAGDETDAVGDDGDQEEPVGPDEFANDKSGNVIRISIMGKPNTGKSTLTNLLTGKSLSIVSPIAGTTRDTVRGSFTYKDYTFSITDTAGLRRKSKVEDDIEYYSVNRAVKSIDESDVVLLMIDGIEGITEQDKKIASLVIRRGCGIILVLNKIDLFSVANQLEAVTDRLRFLFPILSFAPVVGISAAENTNISKLLNRIISVKCQLGRRVSTADFNAALKRWNDSYSPPRGSNCYFKILYGTQVDVNPVRFLLFVNRKQDFPEVYVSYIKNRIRSEFGMDMIPVSINLRERERTDDSQNRRIPRAAKTVRSADDAEREKRHVKQGKTPARGGKAKAKPREHKVGNVSYNAKHR